MANVVITGANRGIGLAMTQAYLAQGHRVYGLCRAASEALKNSGAEVIEGVDISDFERLSQTLAPLQGVTIDTLVNNAGILGRETLDDLDVASMERQFRVNALGPLKLTQALLPNLKAGSKVALITSRMGSMGDNGSGSRYGYRMSKAALNAAGVSLSRDLADKGIAVAILHPGYVQTDMVNHNGDVTAEYSAQGLMQRIAQLNMENSGTFWHAQGQVLPW
ncbi:3-hydroxybutyrate dehydrogenase [Saliniradius amylolyticus]|uniref:3-hydroxybutyrate dehydrogenase n=1 Tax=Saliniradius amylolyticus TaxID=2183582 RepID=A0A2S2E1X5_9ALTE|nr:SDR family oxidoreductase [Saliniradius amylolyticus]AWL11643.1 3-hydroxybutyrate dehydrogenase [Saliniradius amylolyticus]